MKKTWLVLMLLLVFLIAIYYDLMAIAVLLGIGFILAIIVTDRDWKEMEAAKGSYPGIKEWGEITGTTASILGDYFAKSKKLKNPEKNFNQVLGQGSKNAIELRKKLLKK